MPTGLGKRAAVGVLPVAPEAFRSLISSGTPSECRISGRQPPASGHGNAMLQSLPGGPGRAGGGQELGESRALAFYHQRSLVQAEAAVLDRLGATPLRV